jgi:hypothetical protein
MHRTGPTRRRRAWFIAFLTMAILGGLLALAGSPAGSIAVADETTTSSPSSTSSSTSTSTSTTVPPTTVPPGQEGCTPGFWMQPQHLDAWVGYSPDQTLGSVFTLTGDFAGLADVTLLEALSLEGGPTTVDAAEILLRQAVAALLNAASPDVDYPLTEAEIIAAVNAALASGDRATILALAEELDTFNNLFCPLD